MATFSVNVRSNIKQVEADLQRRFRDQVPFAMAKGLTDTAKDVAAELERSLPRVFDRPTPFTMRAIGVTFARKNTLRATVFIKDKQAEYLALQVEGGIRTPRKRTILTPAAVALNQYGNIGRYKRKQLLGRKDTFEGTIGATAGLWQRQKGRGIKLLIAYDKQTKYEKRFPFYETAKRTIARRIEANFRAALQRAIETRR
jgi:hypothetical protein